MRCTHAREKGIRTPTRSGKSENDTQKLQGACDAGCKATGAAKMKHKKNRERNEECTLRENMWELH